MLDMVAHTFIPALGRQWPAWSTKQVPGHSGLFHREILSGGGGGGKQTNKQRNLWDLVLNAGTLEY